MGLRSNGVKVRAGRVADAVAVRELVEVAFGSEEGRVINSALSELDARGLSQTFFVAVDRDGASRGAERVVGVVGLSRAWVDARRRLVDVLVLSPLAVLPEVQGRGVGAALLKECVTYGDEVGAPMIVLEGDPRYYGVRGWVEGASRGIERPSERIPAAAFQVRLLKTHDAWMAGRLVYPDTWWRHDVVGLRDPQLAEIEAALGDHS
ncbi:GNAT family N-acetyltransferase [Nocardioides daphniae]|uniref:N-acetyltransferase n=1 Tax=Nocardioides daphniae TaxID=402297 RepID=A0A4P7UBL2_9ACTN|nr:GNAT family N-acetyltransferase [Nocardioides daphniae]QCC77104.1 GNAT family N-acetyltransferase [Nocardioides daphniae]GGD19672.1 N-acetyltransferase [Nocardioides daphniae]